jgi:hypothetical protein
VLYHYATSEPVLSHARHARHARTRMSDSVSAWV